MTREEAQHIVDSPVSSPANKAKAQTLLDRLTRDKKPTPTPTPTPDEMVSNFEKMIEEIRSLRVNLPMVKTSVNKESETQEFAAEQRTAQKTTAPKPEPCPREVGSQWQLDGEMHTYLGFENGLHLLSPARDVRSMSPTVVKVSEDTLMGRRKPQSPQEKKYISDGFVGTLEQIRERNRQKQAQAAADIQRRGGLVVGSGDPTLEW